MIDNQLIADRPGGRADGERAEIGEGDARDVHHIAGGETGADGQAQSGVIPDRVIEEGQRIIGPAIPEGRRDGEGQLAVGKDDGVVVATTADRDATGAHEELAAVGDDQAVIVGANSAADGEPDHVGEQAAGVDDEGVVAGAAGTAADGQRAAAHEDGGVGNRHQIGTAAGAADGDGERPAREIADGAIAQWTAIHREDVVAGVGDRADDDAGGGQLPAIGHDQAVVVGRAAADCQRGDIGERDANDTQDITG